MNVLLSSNQTLKGSVLILTLIALFAITLFGGALALLLTSHMQESNLEIDRTKALYLAEAGVYKSIWELKNYGTSSEYDGVINTTSLGEGVFSATFYEDKNLIVASGTVHGVTRIIEVVTE
jgi:Tfp pilus assembly protein PilX